MKKFYIISLLIILSLSAFSQSKNDIILGGSISFIDGVHESVFEIEDYTITNFAPVIGVMVNDQIAVGTAFIYSHSKQNGGYFDYETSSFSFRPFAKFHFNITEKLKYYIRPSITLLASSKINGNNMDEDVFRDLNVHGGLLYFIGGKLAIDVNIGGFAYDFVSEAIVAQLNLNSPTFGIRFYL